MAKKKKIFSCSGNEISPHPKVFFSPDFKNHNEFEELCDLNNQDLDSIEKNGLKKISCPYCGEGFEI